MPDHSPPASTANLVVLQPLSNCSAALRKALETPTEFRDGEIREKPWTAPSSVSPELRREANGRLATLAAALESRAAPRLVAKWLGSLGALVSGQMTEADLRAKITALSPAALEYPAGCFTEASLIRAGKAMQWYPGLKELAEFLDREKSALSAERQRCEGIVRPGARKPDDSGAMTREDKLRWADNFRAIADAISDPSKWAALRGRGG